MDRDVDHDLVAHGQRPFTETGYVCGCWKCFELLTPTTAPRAFPCGASMENRGLTKREWYAGQALLNLQNVLLRASNKAKFEELSMSYPGLSAEGVLARLAFDQADAMIEQGAK